MTIADMILAIRQMGWSPKVTAKKPGYRCDAVRAEFALCTMAVAGGRTRKEAVRRVYEHLRDHWRKGDPQ